MNSPYTNEGEGASYQIPGYAALLLANNAANTQALDQIGNTAGALVAGGIGAYQGFKNPGAFGAGTTPTMGAIKAGAMNFNSFGAPGTGSGTGGAPAEPSAFARLVSGGGAAAPGSGVNFKQFAAMGKTADAVRGAIAASTPVVPGADSPKVFGFSDDEWQHLGTADKVNALNGWKQSEDAKAAVQGYDAGQQHLAEIAQTMTQRQQQIDAAKQGTGAISAYNQAYNAATANGKTPSTGDIMKFAAQAGMSPQTALELAKGNLDNAKAAKDMAPQPGDGTPSNWHNPVTGRDYTIFNRTMLPSKSDAEIALEAQTKANAVGANERLAAITKELIPLYKLSGTAARLPANVAKVARLEAEQQQLLDGGKPAAAGGAADPGAAGNDTDPLGLFKN